MLNALRYMAYICSYSFINCHQEAPNCYFEVIMICFHYNCSECNERDCLSKALKCDNLVNFRNNLIKKALGI